MNNSMVLDTSILICHLEKLATLCFGHITHVCQLLVCVSHTAGPEIQGQSCCYKQSDQVPKNQILVKQKHASILSRAIAFGVNHQVNSHEISNADINLLRTLSYKTIQAICTMFPKNGFSTKNHKSGRAKFYKNWKIKMRKIKHHFFPI